MASKVVSKRKKKDAAVAWKNQDHVPEWFIIGAQS